MISLRPSLALVRSYEEHLGPWSNRILGGVILIGGVVLIMNYHHPYTEIARTIVVTTPIVPLVKGRVIEVPVKPNEDETYAFRSCRYRNSIRDNAEDQHKKV